MYTNNTYEHLKYIMVLVRYRFTKDLSLFFPRFGLRGPIERAIDQAILIDDRLRYRPMVEISGHFAQDTYENMSGNLWEKM